MGTRGAGLWQPAETHPPTRVEPGSSVRLSRLRESSGRPHCPRTLRGLHRAHLPSPTLGGGGNNARLIFIAFPSPPQKIKSLLERQQLKNLHFK